MNQKNFNQVNQKKPNICLIIVFCLILGITLSVIGTYCLSKNFKQTEDNPEKKEEPISVPKVETLSLDDQQVQELFNRMNTFRDSYSMKGKNFDYYQFYLNDELGVDNIDDSMMFVLAFDSIYGAKYRSKEEGYDTNSLQSLRFTLNEINNRVQEMFGKSLNLDKLIEYSSTNEPDLGILPGFKVMGNIEGIIFKYDESQKEFRIELMGIGGPDLGLYETKFISAQKVDDKIEIVNKVMFLYHGICNGKDSYPNKKVKKIYREATTIERPFCDSTVINFDKEIADVSYLEDEDIRIDNYLDKLDSFKWTFIKNEKGNYVFSKVEKIKE